MKLDRLFDSGEPVISFEFYPPKTERGFASLYRTIADLKQLHPAYVSVTWGAGGSTRRKTADLTIQIQRDLNLTAMAHMTCVGSGRTDISQTLDQLQAGGVRNVLALGGDHPDDYKVQAGGFSHANELIEFIRANPNWDLALAGACYPETHTAALSPEADLANLVRKVEAGTDWLITQLFFDNADYFDFVERARAAGIDVPIVAGIMPVVSAEKPRSLFSSVALGLAISRNSFLCGRNLTNVPFSSLTDLIVTWSPGSRTTADAPVEVRSTSTSARWWGKSLRRTALPPRRSATSTARSQVRLATRIWATPPPWRARALTCRRCAWSAAAPPPSRPTACSWVRRRA